MIEEWNAYSEKGSWKTKQKESIKPQKWKRSQIDQNIDEFLFSHHHFVYLFS